MLRDLDTGFTYASQQDFTANVPMDNGEVHRSILHFFAVNTHLITRIIECGFQSFGDVPLPPHSFDYVSRWNNFTFNKWMQLMRAIGFDDFYFEIAKLQSYCKGLIDDFKVSDAVACTCTDFVINEFLNHVGANHFWFTKGNRKFV